MSILFTPLQLGELSLHNRIVMAPLTRCRASEGRVPNALMADYYAQRADAGLILSEATSVMPQGVGYPDTPGLWSEAQVEGWKAVTAAVHAKGGLIAAQLWHVGRISDPVYLDGAQPVAPSAVAAEGHVSLLRPKKDYETPRALELNEIPAIVAAYGEAARNARRAGFDGIELHSANGYLIEQFLGTRANTRTDAYGGSIDNRLRFLREILDAVGREWPSGRIGLHLSPRSDAHDNAMADAPALFGAVAEEARRRKLAFLFTREYVGPDSLAPLLRRTFGGPVIANEKLDVATAEQLIADGKADAAAWGGGFIANPDLVARIKRNQPWNEVNWRTCYGVGGLGPVGYTDYPRAS